eukprot:6152866-Pleurochrysis_carterae.AAC.1
MSLHYEIKLSGLFRDIFPVLSFFVLAGPKMATIARDAAQLRTAARQTAARTSGSGALLGI